VTSQRLEQTNPAATLATARPPCLERALFDAAMAAGLPVALWRHAKHEGAGGVFSDAVAHGRGTEGLVMLGEAEQTSGIDFAQRRPGFVFAPFSDQHGSLFLRDDVRLADGRIALRPGADPAAEALMADACARLLTDDRHAQPSWHTAPTNPADRAITQADFEALVRDAIAFINDAGIAKVVVSRTAPVELPQGFHPVDLFTALCERYPHAFVSLVSVPGAGTWVGASPELLLGLDDASLTTVALAGTQKRNGVPIEQIVWGRKEIIEQAMVSRYVCDFFAGAQAHDVEQSGPQTVTAGGVVHLKSSFRVVRPEAERMRLANRVLGELHPTSAVCGMPRREALSFIQAREGYDRGFYSGYLGPVHIEGRSALYVNLRCMQLRSAPNDGSRPSASLYVGAGITADSDPTAEWRETELKTRTILDALAMGGAPTGGTNAQLTRGMQDGSDSQGSDVALSHAEAAPATPQARRTAAFPATPQLAAPWPAQTTALPLG
jgi:isochorismate synthase